MIEEATELGVYCSKKGKNAKKTKQKNKTRRRVFLFRGHDPAQHGAAAASTVRVNAFVTFDIVGFGLIQEAGRRDAHVAAAGFGSTGTAGSPGTSDTVTSVRTRGGWKNLLLLQLLLLHSHSNFFVLQEAL